MPSGRLVKAQPNKFRCARLVRLSNKPDGRLRRAGLFCR